jgi:hypothetical protein
MTAPHRKSVGRCIFCGATGLTKEHMWADWLKSYIPRTESAHVEGLTLVHLDRDEETISRRTGDPHSRRIRCVCQSCNNGWMSRLQETVKPFLVPMLVGNRTNLHRRGQTVVAAWSAMMVMVSEHIHEEMVATPLSERVYLRERGVVPPCWRIWIGCHSRRDHPLFTHRATTFVTTKEEMERLRGSPARISNTQISTICIGRHILIHVMSSRVAWSIVRRWKFPPQISAGLVQIWPIKAGNATWPPSQALTDSGISFVANDFFDKAAALIRNRNA